jgi:protein-disulfide isomerase
MPGYLANLRKIVLVNNKKSQPVKKSGLVNKSMSSKRTGNKASQKVALGAKRAPYIWYGLISLVAVLVVTALIVAGRPESSSTAAGHLGPDPDIPHGITQDGYPYLGNVEAPLTIREYEDFGCHNCRDFAIEVEPLLIDQYVATGKVLLISNPVAFVNAQSLPAAEAAACAAEQAKYWEYRHVLFANQGVVAFNRNNLIDFAGQAGLESEPFTNCIAQRRYQSLVEYRTRSAQQAGVSGTPTFDIGEERFVGLVPFDSTDLTRPGIVQLIEMVNSGNE